VGIASNVLGKARRKKACVVDWISKAKCQVALGGVLAAIIAGEIFKMVS